MTRTLRQLSYFWKWETIIPLSVRVNKYFPFGNVGLDFGGPFLFKG